MKRIGFSNIIYFIKSGLEGAKFNSAMTAASIAIMVAGLCIFGVYSVISQNINFLVRQMNAGYVVTAFLEKGTPPERAYEISEELKKNENVRDVSYTSEEDALKECIEMFGEEAAFLEGLEAENPLRSSLDITMYNIAASQNIADLAEGITDVASVKNDSQTAEKMVAFTNGLQKYSIVLMAVFAALDIFIISNTIRITIISRKDEIYIMRYLGASNSYIKIPFIVEGILIGLIGAIITSVLVLGCYTVLYSNISTYFNGMMRIYYPTEIAFDLCIKFITIGLGMGIASTAIPVAKYLKV